MADTPKDESLSKAGRDGIAKRLEAIGGTELSAPAREALQRLRDVERAIDPGKLLNPRERRQVARLHIEIEDRQRRLAAFAAGVIQRHQEELDAKQADLQRLTALVAA